MKLFDLEEYKEILCVNTGGRKLGGESDAFFESVIANTEKFVDKLIEGMNSNRILYGQDIVGEYDLPYNVGEREGAVGGKVVDKLIGNDKSGIWVSRRLIEDFFGKNFQSHLGSREVQTYNAQEDAGCLYDVPVFYVRGPVAEFDKIYAQYAESPRRAEAARRMEKDKDNAKQFEVDFIDVVLEM